MSGEGDVPQAIRKLVPGKLVIASHNAGKVREIRELLGPYGIEPVSAAELDLPEPEETGTSFVANAELKALQATDLSGLPALADDSGLCVEALNLAPGIYSARWGPPRPGWTGWSRSPPSKAAISAWRCSACRTSWRRCRRNPAGPRTSCAHSRSPGRMGMSSGSRAESMANWSGRRAATRALAMIPCSCRWGMRRPLAKWIHPQSMQ